MDESYLIGGYSLSDKVTYQGPPTIEEWMDKAMGNESFARKFSEGLDQLDLALKSITDALDRSVILDERDYRLVIY